MHSDEGRRAGGPSAKPALEVSMRLVVLVMAVVSALAGALMVEEGSPVQPELEATDPPLFV